MIAVMAPIRTNTRSPKNRDLNCLDLGMESTSAIWSHRLVGYSSAPLDAVGLQYDPHSWNSPF